MFSSYEMQLYLEKGLQLVDRLLLLNRRIEKCLAQGRYRRVLSNVEEREDLLHDLHKLAVRLSGRRPKTYDQESSQDGGRDHLHCKMQELIQAMHALSQDSEQTEIRLQDCQDKLSAELEKMTAEHRLVKAYAHKDQSQRYLNMPA